MNKPEIKGSYSRIPSTEKYIGKTYNSLTVISLSHSNGNVFLYTCKCVCGGIRISDSYSLRSGKIKRCAECKRNIHKKHGMKGTFTWNIWMGIKARILNPKNAAFKNYGGRGITIDPKWLKFEGFHEDMGTRPDGLQIDRVDNNKGYYKENCRWVTPKINSNNRRTKNAS